jgi:hypothetical protein
MPITYSDACKTIHHVVGGRLSVQLLVLHITCDPEAAPSSELDKVKHRVISMSPASCMQSHERFLNTTIQDQDLKENMMVSVGGGGEDASLAEEDDRIYREGVKYEPQSIPTQS